MDSHREADTLPECLSAKFKDTFAYKTIKDRLPVILTKIVDTTHRMNIKIKEEKGEEASEELKSLTGCLSELIHQIRTDKDVVLFKDSRSDAHVWNSHLQHIVDENNGQPIKWFSASWLLLECYMYRRIQETVELSKHLKGLDVFKEQKQNAYLGSYQAIRTLLTYLMDIAGKAEELSPPGKEEMFLEFLQVALWGNKCDLSISAGLENAQTQCILDQLHALRPNVLIDDAHSVFRSLQTSCTSRGAPGRVDIVLDNAGFELVTDLCFAEMLISLGFASVIHFHGKAYPWFVSDVTQEDFDWTLLTMSGTNNLAISRFGANWRERIKSGSWVFHAGEFWTTPFDYSFMKKQDCDLYKELGKADMIFFKGDLNYRKLVGDRSWDSTVPFPTALQGFEPAPLCALRALKADVVTGLRPGQAEEVVVKEEGWMVSGNWAVISFHCPNKQ